MEDVFAYSSCNAEFINSATKIRALIVTCEFFLINATTADFYRLTCNKNCNNFLMHEDLQRFPEKSFSGSEFVCKKKNNSAYLLSKQQCFIAFTFYIDLINII